MKKKLPLVAAILLFAVSSAWADTLDVCLPWTHAQRYVPINTAYADWGFENEFIYPASRVNEMAGGTITQITFYAMSDSLDFPETFQLRMEEVADTATQSLAWVRTYMMYQQSYKLLIMFSAYARQDTIPSLAAMPTRSMSSTAGGAIHHRCFLR